MTEIINKTTFKLLNDCSILLNKVFVYRQESMKEEGNADCIDTIEHLIGMEFPANEVQEMAVKINEHISDVIIMNENLIAAAPDMLEVLKSIENDDNSIPASIWEMRDNAIAKAEGRS